MYGSASFIGSDTADTVYDGRICETLETAGSDFASTVMKSEGSFSNTADAVAYVPDLSDLVMSATVH